MKVKEILYEIKKGEDVGNAMSGDKYWVVYNKDTVDTFPRFSNLTYEFDLAQHYNNGEPLSKDWYTNDDEKEARKKAETFLRRDYRNGNSFGIFLVDNSKKIINLDITKYTGSDDRRLATKIKSFNHKAKHAYPILGAETAFDRTTELYKVLKHLTKISPKTVDYEVYGDDRADGATVAEILAGKSDFAKADHRKLFSPKLENVTMYHGTSKSRAKKILKDGFKPGSRDETYGDLVKNYSEHNVYLALNPATAAGYAVREAINTSSDAVVLAVELKPSQVLKLRPDEDSLYWLDKTVPPEYYNRLIKRNPIIGEIWGTELGAFQMHFKNLNHTDKKLNLSWILDQYGVDKEFKENAIKVFNKYNLIDGDNRDKLIEFEKRLYVEIVSTFINGAHSSGIKKMGTVAYPGPISASQISVVKTWSLEDSKMLAHNYDKAKDYDAGIDKQRASVIKKSLK